MSLRVREKYFLALLQEPYGSGQHRCRLPYRRYRYNHELPCSRYGHPYCQGVARHGCSAVPLPLANHRCGSSLHHLWQVYRLSLCHPHTHLWSYSSSTSLKYILSGDIHPELESSFHPQVWHDCPHLSLRSSLHRPTSLPSHCPAVRHNPRRSAPFSSIFSYVPGRDAPWRS